MILGIDPGSNCGWCVMSPDGEVVACGTWALNTPPSRFRGALFLRLQSHLETALAGAPCTLIVHERVFQNTSEAQDRIYGGIVGMIETVAASWEIPTAAVAVATAKKHATGDGRAEKPAMLAAARARWGDKVQTHDQADACWLADAARLGLHTRIAEAKAAKKKRAKQARLTK
jgi:Holliday junction resolvasome RuvABC endonuclease subunit